MAQQLSDLFALEAGEYLDEIDALLTREAAPDAEHLLRLVRRVRGSARLAQAERVVEVAERFERACLALLQGRLAWSGELRARAIRTVDDLRVLVRAIRGWGAAEDARADAAVARWAEVLPHDAQVGVAATGGAAGGGAAAGARLLPYVRSELAGIRVEMGRALTEWATSGDPAAALQRVQLRMRAIRGVQGVEPLGPLLALLEGIDDAIRLLLRRGAAAHEQGRTALTAASAALAHAAGDVERDRFPAAADADAARFRQLVAALGTGADSVEPDPVVPIHTLFFDDGRPNIVASPVAPVPADDEAESPAVADFLRLKATGLVDRAEAMLHEMRAQGLPAVTSQLAELASALHDLAAAYGVRPLRDAAGRAVAELRGAESVETARSVVARVREALGGGLHRIADVVLPADAGAADEAAEPQPPRLPAGVAAALAEDPAGEAADAGLSADAVPADDGVVPIESLLLSGEAALAAALSMRSDVEELLGSQAPEPLREAVDELFALLRQAMPRPGGG